MRRALLCLCLLLVSLAVSAQASGSLSTVQERPFAAGEAFEMSITYKWGALNPEVAKAWVSLEELSYLGIPSYHSSIRVKSAAFFDAFFTMREHFQSWFDASTLKPYKFIRDTREGNYTAYNLYIYDWQAGAIHANIQFEGRGPQTLDIPLEEGVYDLPSLIYYVRSLDYERIGAGKSFPLDFAMDEDVDHVRLTYHGSERIKVRRLGYVQAHHFSCSTISGAMFEGNEQLQFWMSADDNRIPVAIRVPLRVGAVQCWLSAYSGLKHPFNALESK